MLKVRNNQTGEIQELPEEQVPEAVASGTYSIQKGIKLPVISPDGKRGTIDSGEAYTAFQSGFTYETPAQQEEFRKQEEFGNRPVAAAALGAARSLTLGVSDQALEKTGLVEQETLREIKDRNPELSTVGEAAGIIAPAFVTGGSNVLARGATSAVRGASSAGIATETAVAKVLAKRLAATGEQTLAKKVLATAGSKAIGSAVEGAFYGAGHLISEDALGNAELNAESLMANMGTGAIIGGVAGGVLGAGEVGVKAAADFTKQKIIKPVQPFLRKLLGAKDLPEEVGMLGSLTQKKANVDELRQAASELEVKLTSGAESANQRVRDAESILNETPTIFGESVREARDEIRTGLQKNADKVLAVAGEKTEREVGEQIKDEVIAQLKSKYDPFKKAYEEIRTHRPHVDLEDTLHVKSLRQTSRNIGKLGGEIGSRGGEIAKYTEQKSLQVLQQKTVDDLANLASEVKSEARAFARSGNDRMAFAAREVGRRIDNLQDRVITREAVRLAREGAPEAGAAARQLIRDMRGTNQEYAKFQSFVTEVSKEAKLGRGNFRQVVEKLENLSPEQVTRKFFNMRDSKSLEFMRETFPAQFEELRRLEVAKIASKVAKNDPTYGPMVDINALGREYNKLSPEMRVTLFGADGARTIENIQKVSSAIPGVSNPSRTDIRADFSRLLTPVLWLRDLALLGMLKGSEALSKEAITVRGVQSLAQVEKSQAKVTKTVKNTVDRFLNGTSKVSERVPALTTNAIMDVSFSRQRRRKEESLEQAYYKRADEIAAAVADPAQFAENFQQQNAILGTVAPKTTIALQNKALSAISFLHSKLPSNPAAARTNNLSIRKWKPSTVEIKKFERYMKAVDKPLSVLEDLERGTMSREGVEVLRTVYPEIYGSIVSEVTNRVAELRVGLPYKKRLMLSTLLGVPIDLAQEPQYLMSLQETYMPKEQGEEQSGGAVRTTAKALSNLDLASQVETEAQRITGKS